MLNAEVAALFFRLDVPEELLSVRHDRDLHDNAVVDHWTDHVVDNVTSLPNSCRGSFGTSISIQSSFRFSALSVPVTTPGARFFTSVCGLRNLRSVAAIASRDPGDRTIGATSLSSVERISSRLNVLPVGRS